MDSTTRHETDLRAPWPADDSGRGSRAASMVRMSTIWVRTVARSWRSGIRDLYSHIP